MDACYSENICNCKRDCSCDDEFECCTEKPPKGDAKLGICVKTGTCDKKRGICQSRSNFKDSKMEGEYYSTERAEYYSNGDTKNTYIYCGIIVVLVIIFALIIVYLTRNRR